MLKGLLGNILLGVMVFFSINFEFVGIFKLMVLYLVRVILELLYNFVNNYFDKFIGIGVVVVIIINGFIFKAIVIFNFLFCFVVLCKCLVFFCIDS